MSVAVWILFAAGVILVFGAGQSAGRTILRYPSVRTEAAIPRTIRNRIGREIRMKGSLPSDPTLRPIAITWVRQESVRGPLLILPIVLVWVGLALILSPLYLISGAFALPLVLQILVIAIATLVCRNMTREIRACRVLVGQIL
jgi:hypothetical protein